MAEQKNRGALISVAGLDGSGKSTLASLIATYCRTAGYEDVVETSAISDNCTPICQDIGAILKKTNYPERIPEDAEMALMLAARVINWKNVVEPALNRGAVVVSDRWRTCMSVYQRDKFGDFIHPYDCRKRLESFGLDVDADLEIILDVDPANPHKAHDAEGNRLEKRSMYEWNKMRVRYRRAAETNPNTIFIHTNFSRDTVWRAVKPFIDAVLNGEELPDREVPK